MPKNEKTYKQLQEELDGILILLQSGELDIDESMKAYEKGLTLVAQLEKYLKTAENTINKITSQTKRSGPKKS